jgi:hypothetical protein
LHHIQFLRGFNEIAFADDVVASAEILCIAPDGTEFDARVAVARPYRAPSGEWRYPVVMAALQERLPDMAGEDSLQALCMALSTVCVLLEHFVEQRGLILYRGSRSPFDI